jgi:hypothetical protein
MATSPDPIATSPATLRQLARDNQEMGSRLAHLEFQAMIRELRNPNLFDLRLDFPNDPGPWLDSPMLTEDPSSQRMPQLNVTLGKIAWVYDPASLPVIAIFVPDTDSLKLRETLEALLTAHHTHPFARFVFLCESLRPVPFLGRFELTYEHLGKLVPVDVARRLRLRFGVQQIRNLVSGQLLWRVPRTVATD